VPIKKTVEQYIAFRIGRQDFAMDASLICGLLPIYEMLPLDPPRGWICGLASIRGREFPVIDLRARFNLPRGVPGRQPCVIAVEIHGSQLVGFIADRVSDVTQVRARDFRGDQVIIAGKPRRLLHPDRLLTAEDLVNLSRLSKSVPQTHS
jgi:chemotaxis signal transduction protein